MEELKRQARIACASRGHTMYPWHEFSCGNVVSRCVYCAREVQVLKHPAPNQVDIGGEAVALDCEATCVVKKTFRA